MIKEVREEQVRKEKEKRGLRKAKQKDNSDKKIPSKEEVNAIEETKIKKKQTKIPRDDKRPEKNRFEKRKKK